MRTSGPTPGHGDDDEARLVHEPEPTPSAAGPAPVVLIGDGLLAEDHARFAGTITYELVCGIPHGPSRAERLVLDG